MRIIEAHFWFLCHDLLQFFLIRNRTDFALKNLGIFMMISYFIETENEKSFSVFQSCSLACVLMLRQTCFKIRPLSNFCYSRQASSLCTMYLLLHSSYNSMTIISRSKWICRFIFHVYHNFVQTTSSHVRYNVWNKNGKVPRRSPFVLFGRLKR